MNDGHLNLDLLPDLAHGRGTLTQEERAHLLLCPACRAEWEMVHAAVQLGERQSARFDGQRVAARVHARLTGAPGTLRPTRWGPLLLAAAAVLLFALWSTRPNANDPIPQAGNPASVVALHELDSLDVAQLERVLAEIPADTSHIEQLPLLDLTTDDLERVLRSMEE